MAGVLGRATRLQSERSLAPQEKSTSNTASPSPVAQRTRTIIKYYSTGSYPGVNGMTRGKHSISFLKSRRIYSGRNLVLLFTLSFICAYLEVGKIEPCRPEMPRC